MLESLLLTVVAPLAAPLSPAQDSPFDRRFDTADRYAEDVGPGDVDPDVLAALNAAALWLAERQRVDGSWDGDLARTSLATLALLGAGHGLDHGALKFATREGLAWLARNRSSELDPRARALQVLALVETYDVEASVEVFERVEELASGWTGRAGEELDAVAWRLLALRGAEEIGVAVDSREVVRALDELERLEVGEEPTSRALALAARVAAGQTTARHPALAAAVARLTTGRLDVSAASADELLVASVALRELGDAAWERWRGALHPALLASQGDDGSWAANVERTASLALCLAFDPTLPGASAVVEETEVEEPILRPALISDPRGDALARTRDRARDWLRRHQSSAGHWRSESSRGVSGAWGPSDIGVTALGAIALFDGDEEDAAAAWRAVRWLREQQDPESGLVGESIGHTYHYDHGIATFALVRALQREEDATLRAATQRAVDYIHRARNPYGAWRYDSPPIGDNDTSVTGWMIAALLEAREAGLETDEAALRGGLEWVRAVTDPETGRVGYDSRGSRSSRIVSINESWPPESSEGMTAAGLWMQLRLAPGFASTELCRKQVGLLAATPPTWDPGVGCDMLYWMYGARALRILDGPVWEEWRAALVDVAVSNQAGEGAHDGSWDPAGPWGPIGGRAYSTAVMLLALR